MKKTILACSLLGAVSLSFGTFAADVSYDHVGVGYTSTKIKDATIEPSGIEINFSKLLTDSVYVRALGNMTSDNDNSTVDYRYEQSTAELGFGYRAGVLDSVDVFTDVSYVTSSIKVKSLELNETDSESGYAFALGTRAAFTHEWNADLYFKHVEYKTDGLSQVGLNIRYAFDNVDLMAGVASGDDHDSWGLGLQYKF